jgi:small-conductance mechanosensitive channel
MFVGLAVAPAEKPGLGTRLWSRAFPLCPLIVLLLLGLQWAGYLALVDYLIKALLQTLLVLAAARVLRGLLAAWSGFTHESASEPRADENAEINTLAGYPLVRASAQIARLAVLLAALLLILHAWGVSFVEIREGSNLSILHTEKGPITPRRIVAAVLAVAAGVILSRTLRAFLHTEVFPQTRYIDRGTQAAITMLLHYSIIALAAYVGLRLLLLDLGVLAILLGTLGLGLGLGLQPLFINFISGLMILFERQVKVGDIIEIDGTPGEILAISMRSVRIKTPDNTEHVIPNGDFVTGRVINWTLSDQHIRARLQIGVAYGSDVQLVRKLLLDIAHRHPDVLVDPPPEVWFIDFADNALIFVLVCWFANAAARWRFLSQVRFEMTDIFKQHNINIPFPQRTLSLLGDKPLAVELRRPGRPAPASPTPPEK